MSITSSRSAGLLMYRKGFDTVEVFLVHPGGPYWLKKNEGFWTIPKGEYEADEDPLAAAIREFREETGFSVLNRLRANGDRSVQSQCLPTPDGAGGLAAVAGYPHLTVPMGAVFGLPVGLSFIGPAWSEARLLGYGYAYEQVAKARILPGLVPAIEEVEPSAPLLDPLDR